MASSRINNRKAFLSALASNNPGAVLIFGEDAFIRQELAQTAIHWFKERGFDSILRPQEGKDGLAKVEETLAEYGLFAQTRIIVLDIVSGIPANFGKMTEILAKYASEETAVVVSGPHLTKAQEKAAWFRSLLSYPGCLYNAFFTPQDDQLDKWFSEFSRDEFGVALDKSALDLLRISCEGDLSTGVNAIRTVALAKSSGSNGPISSDALSKVIANGTRYASFDLTDAMFKNGDLDRSARIMKRLSETESLEGVLWLVERDLSMLSLLKQCMADSKHQSEDALFKSQPMLLYKRDSFARCALHMDVAHIDALLALFAKCKDAQCRFDKDLAWQHLQIYVAAFFDKELALAITQCK